MMIIIFDQQMARLIATFSARKAIKGRQAATPRDFKYGSAAITATTCPAADNCTAIKLTRVLALQAARVTAVGAILVRRQRSVPLVAVILGLATLVGIAGGISNTFAIGALPLI